ncbi:hypothetical protein PRZ48_001025 [Zasmidium cellare]|uniref:Glutathione synthetase n=1 Tax=Zasmidium cellare TaxID=395010 RepID=A0ABR0F0T9_ZASCE|nr:hypothetical protein PRZ48_001025 [Zasmidium cellare]
MNNPNDHKVEQLVNEIRDYQITHGSLLKLVRLEEPESPSVPSRPPNGSLPESSNTSSIVDSLALAHEYYKPSTPKRACVLMIVQGVNFNIADERPIEYGLADKRVPCYRCEWFDAMGRTFLQGDATLIFDNPFSGEQFEVSVIYYRAGYECKEYRGRGSDIRLHLEQSRAIKCPDLLTHLMTFKITQAALAKQGVIGRYLSSQDATRIRDTFMPMHAMDGSEDAHRLRQEAMCPTDGASYVVKPNLEGGGHNVYNEAVPEFLALIDREVSSGYTIMKMIEPPETFGLLNTGDKVYQGPVVSELGVIGTCLWRRSKEGVEIISNKAAGWTFKTKPNGVQEMNVVKGNGCFDCPLLT